MTKGRLLFLCLSVVSLFSLGACASKVDKPQKSETVKSESKSKSEAQEEVISQETSEVELKSTINIEEIAQNNFSSLIGTWTNPTSGQTITVTGEMMNRPEGSSGAASGVILANTAENGYPKVITSGNISNAIEIHAGIHTVDNKNQDDGMFHSTTMFPALRSGNGSRSVHFRIIIIVI